jgi:virginiamycin B lyase
MAGCERYGLGLVFIILAILFTPGVEACRPFGSYAFVEDSEGGVWFTEGDNNAVSRLSPDGTVIAYPIPTPAAEPADLALDQQGNLWFVELNGGKIGRLSPDGRIKEYSLADQHAHPWQLWVDPNGEIWFLEGRDPARVGRLLPDGVIRNYILAEGWPTSMASASDGGLWLSVLIPAETHGTDLVRASGRILHLSRDGTWRERLSRTASCPMNVIPDDQGRLWFSDRCRHTIERLDHKGERLRFEMPEEAFIQDMALDSDGNLWFIDNTRNLIGRIDPEKGTRTYPLPGETGGPFAMALSRNGGIIFSETYNYNINRLSPNGIFTEQLVNVDHRQNVESVEQDGICYLRFASFLQRKEEIEAKRTAAIASTSLAEEGSQGARLLRKRCLACHDLKRILLARKSDWRPSLGLMDTYMGQRHMISLNDDEQELLLKYLNTHYNIGQ